MDRLHLRTADFRAYLLGGGRHVDHPNALNNFLMNTTASSYLAVFATRDDIVDSSYNVGKKNLLHFLKNVDHVQMGGYLKMEFLTLWLPQFTKLRTVRMSGLGLRGPGDMEDVMEALPASVTNF